MFVFTVLGVLYVTNKKSIPNPTHSPRYIARFRTVGLLQVSINAFMLPYNLLLSSLVVESKPSLGPGVILIKVFCCVVCAPHAIEDCAVLPSHELPSVNISVNHLES